MLFQWPVDYFYAILQNLMKEKIAMSTIQNYNSFQKFRSILEEETSLDNAVDAFAMIENGEVDIAAHYLNNTQHYGNYTPAIWALIYGKDDLASLILHKYGRKAFAIKDQKGLYPIDYLFSDPNNENISIAAKLCSIVPGMCGDGNITLTQTVCRDAHKQSTCDSIQCCYDLECVTILYSFDNESTAFTKEVMGISPCGLNIEMG